MPSRRGQLLLFLMKHRHLLQGRLKPQNFFDGSTTLEEFRRSVDRVPKYFGGLPGDIAIDPVDIGGLYAEWLRPSGDAGSTAILYFHGGGYVSGTCRAHRMHVAKVVRGASMSALVFEYRLAPEYPFPAALDDALAAYRYLLDKGYAPARIAFMGDSAGGGLVLAALLGAREAGLPMPVAAVALSPWTDLACTGDTYRTVTDPLAPLDSWTVFSRYYAGDNDPHNPLMSPLYGDLAGLPPLLLYAGEHEALRDDTTRFAEKARRAGVDVTSHVGEGMFHCYPICAPLFPEATEAMAECCAFIREHTIDTWTAFSGAVATLAIDRGIIPPGNHFPPQATTLRIAPNIYR